MAVITVPQSASRRASAASIIAAYLTAYCVANFLLPRAVEGGWNVYFAQPLVWLILGVWCLRRADSPSRPGRIALGAGALIGLFQVAVFTLTGLLYGFGHSPYAHSLIAIAGNITYLTAMLAATELARARLVESLGDSIRFATGGVALLFAIMALPFNQWQALSTGRTSPFAFSGERFLPAVIESSVATAFLGLGGPWAGLAYRLTIHMTEWLAPVLPALAWPQMAVASAIVAAAAAPVFRDGSSNAPGRTDAAGARPGLPISLYTAAFMVVAVIWLNTGLLGVRPALITGISMEPSLVEGDIVFTRVVAPQMLEPGDIIRFQAGGVPVLHRIREVARTPGGLVFVTQGDNNAYPDALVPVDAVEGEVLFTIPKAGLVPITVRQWLGR